MRRALFLAAGLALAGAAGAQVVNPLGILGKAVGTAMDVRTRSEVANDTEIAAGASKRLLDDQDAEWSGVSFLVFQQHVVLAGAVKSAPMRKKVEELARQDARIRSFRSELRVGDVASLVKDTTLGARINAALTAEEGVSSVNMRWNATGGQVVLMGVAQSKEEAALAVAKVRGISGVKGVKSHLRVVPPKK